MSTAIFYDEQPLISEDQENFEGIIKPMLNLWLTAFRNIKATGEIDGNTLQYLKNAAFMATIPANRNIPVNLNIIDNLREIFKIVRYDILENPLHSKMPPENKARFEKFNMRLAKAITILDLANDPEIAEIFADAKK